MSQDTPTDVPAEDTPIESAETPVLESAAEAAETETEDDGWRAAAE